MVARGGGVTIYEGVSGSDALAVAYAQHLEKLAVGKPGRFQVPNAMGE